MTLQSAYFEKWKGSNTLLLWGDGSGMRALADFLRQVESSADRLSFDNCCMAVDERQINIKIVSDQRDTGMRFAQTGLEWALRPELADDFARKVDALSAGVGHQYLEAYNNQITVEVSVGEWSAELRPAKSNPPRTPETDAVARKCVPPLGSVTLTASALAQISAFMGEVRLREPQADWIAALSWGTGRKMRGPDEAEWVQLNDGLDLGCFLRSEVPPDLIDKVGHIDVIFIAPDPSMLARKTIDWQNGDFVLRD